jgi:hypothetical protein
MPDSVYNFQFIVQMHSVPEKEPVQKILPQASNLLSAISGFIRSMQHIVMYGNDVYVNLVTLRQN